MGLCSCCDAFLHRLMGRMSFVQRLLFVFTSLALLAVNAAYLSYVVRKAQDSADNPSVSLSTQPWTRFPDYMLLLVPMSIYGSSTTANDCLNLLNTTCVYEQLNASGYPIPTNDSSRVHCDKNGYAALPGDLWIPNSARIGSSRLRITLTGPSDISAKCAGAAGFVRAYDEPSGVGNASPSFTFRFGSAGRLLLAASLDRAADGTELFHVSSTGSVDLGPVPSAPGSVTFEVRSDIVNTSPLMTITTESITYDWKDALASFFAVVNVSITLLAFLFPLTPLVPHARLFFLDRKVTDDPLDHAANKPASNTPLLPTDN
jgi:hypothetical protein